MSADLEAGQDTRPRPAVSDSIVMALSRSRSVSASSW